jgi:hypothetical protein
MNDKETDKSIVRYMAGKSGKSISVCMAIFQSKTRHDKDLMRKRHLSWRISMLEKEIQDFHRASHGCYRTDNLNISGGGMLTKQQKLNIKDMIEGDNT